MPRNSNKAPFNKTEIINKQKKIKGIRAFYGVIREAVDIALKQEGLTLPCEVSVSFVDNDEIARLNAEFRDKPEPTDVLSFPSGDYPPEAKGVFLGDIIISLERAKEQTVKCDDGLKYEVAFLTAHSALHLLGYDHMKKKDAAIMFEKQDTIMELMGIPRKMKDYASEK